MDLTENFLSCAVRFDGGEPYEITRDAPVMVAHATHDIPPEEFKM
jgi:hypothetical protein